MVTFKRLKQEVTQRYNQYLSWIVKVVVFRTILKQTPTQFEHPVKSLLGVITITRKS